MAKLVPHVNPARDGRTWSPSLGWEDIGQRALARSRRVTIPSFMYGPLSSTVHGAGASVLTEPRQNDANIKGGGSTDAAEKNEMLRIIEANGSINLFRLIINPDDFGQSVENLFHLSCLFYEGVCAYHLNANGEPIISHVLSTGQEPQVTPNRHQIVFEFDMATWRHAIEVFEITESVMPHHTPPCV
ncbi:Nse4 C-terminal-domain-containing protein [Suillus fuscotomentosus]|uniref:Non-structural maintenance of chromosomes element 4 n=1 Tax=Suillus fuscotomentosus TaxID=1912939 RepID=A0AAD4DV42_9AGAM|nr:Nse4 C-terminal-domain-containing protein [Suillus fuscotomentosus]KAG1894376.1 Nse4 C-terminal-domain-containing protein [Suillus fuscotomentosus]